MFNPLILLLLSSLALCASNNVAVYWGQNTEGYLTNFKSNEKELWWYCNWDNIDIVILAFMKDFPGTYSSELGISVPTVYFPHHDNDEFSINSTKTMKKLQRDIKYCQKKNKKVLLSLGGQSGNYSVTSESEGTALAKTMWYMFGPEKHAKTSTNKTYPRPFGNAVIDGFDFDVETSTSATSGYTSLISTLQSYASNGTQKLYITAAPQCPYPDENLSEILSSSYLDKLFIQFYNNDCNTDLAGFNWDTWAQYAQNVSKNSDVELYLGLPGSVNSSSTGYINNATYLDTVISNVSNSSNFAGVMLWEASLAFKTKLSDSKKSYPETVKSLLNKVTGQTSGTSKVSAKATYVAISVSFALFLLL